MADSFVFYRSFYEALKEVEPEYRLTIWEAICEYMLNGEVPQGLNSIASMAWKLILPQLEANRRRREASLENAAKGGAPKGNQNARKQPKNNLNQPNTTYGNSLVDLETTENNSNVNVNDNVNDNVNVNPNVNVNENANENVNVNVGPPWYTDRHGAYFDRDGRTLLTDMRAEGFRRQGAEDSLFEYCIAKMGEQEGVKNPAKYLETMIREHVDYGRMTWEEAERHDRERKKNKGKSEDKKEDYPIYDPPDWG